MRKCEGSDARMPSTRAVSTSGLPSTMNTARCAMGPSFQGLEGWRGHRSESSRQYQSCLWCRGRHGDGRLGVLDRDLMLGESDECVCVCVLFIGEAGT